MFYAHLLLKYTVNGAQAFPSFVLGMGDAEVTQAGSLPLMCQISGGCTGWGQVGDRGMCPVLGVLGGGLGELPEDGVPKMLKGWVGVPQAQSGRKDWPGRGKGKVRGVEVYLGKRSHPIGGSTEILSAGIADWLDEAGVESCSGRAPHAG